MLDKQVAQHSDPAWSNLSVAATCHHMDEDKMQIESEIAQNLVEESKTIFMKMHLPNHFSVHIRQLGNRLNVSSGLPKQAMMNHQQAY
jgi:hypothetical protein